MNFLNFLIISFTVVNHSITIAWNIESLILQYYTEAESLNTQISEECASIFEAGKEFFKRLGSENGRDLITAFYIHKELCSPPFKG